MGLDSLLNIFSQAFGFYAGGFIIKSVCGGGFQRANGIGFLEVGVHSESLVWCLVFLRVGISVFWQLWSSSS